MLVCLTVVTRSNFSWGSVQSSAPSDANGTPEHLTYVAHWNIKYDQTVFTC